MDIICVASPSWDGNYVKSTVELMKRMAQRYRILYVDYPQTYKDLFFNHSSNPGNTKRMLGCLERMREVSGSNGSTLHVLTLPPVFPANFIKNHKTYDYIQKINASTVRKSILKASRELGFNHPVVVNAFNPFLGNFLLGKLNESKTIYYCYDEIGACAWTEAHGAYSENKYIRRVDAAIVTSKGLLETKSKLCTSCFLVENGVDYELFKSGYQQHKDHPIIIGYIGTIDSRIDFDYIEAVARNFPNSRVMMVGRVIEDRPSVGEGLVKLQRFTNIDWIGAQDAKMLPDFLKRFHLGLIPFVKNTQTAAIYPMKINEYLAAGIPVVSTDFAPLPDFSGVISIASSVSEFLQCIEVELMQNSVEKQKYRQNAVSSNSWENRALLFEKILEIA